MNFLNNLQQTSNQQTCGIKATRKYFQTPHGITRRLDKVSAYRDLRWQSSMANSLRDFFHIGARFSFDYLGFDQNALIQF